MFQMTKIVKKIPILNQRIYNFANSYVNSYVGFHSHIESNGEKKLLQLLQGVYPNNKFVFVDGGANVGSWTKAVLEYFSNYEGHLFELMPATYKILQYNLAGKENLHINNFGLSDKSEISYATNFGDGHACNTLVTSLVNRRPQEAQQQVECIKLDQYCQSAGINNIDLLKLDVEGYEFPALLGAKQLLENHKVKVVQFEYSASNLERKEITRDFYDFLEPFGYKIGPLRPAGVHFQAYHSELNCSRSGPNYVACLPDFVSILAEK